MTAAELMAALRRFPPGAEIRIETCDYDEYPAQVADRDGTPAIVVACTTDCGVHRD